MFAAFDELLELDLIRPTATPRRFRFRHPIVRRAVYDSAPGGWRIGAHARASAALEAAHAPVSARAHHVETFATPGDEDALELLVHAAREAAPRAPDAAGRWLIAATRLLPPHADVQRRQWLLVEASSATLLAGSYDLALEILAEATGLLDSEQVAERGRLVARTAFARRMSGHPLQSRSLVTQTLEELARRQRGGAQPDARAGARSLLARSSSRRCTRSRRRCWTKRGIKRALRESADFLRGRTCQHRQHRPEPPDRGTLGAGHGDGGVHRVAG